MGKWIDADALKQQVESPYTEYPIMIQIRKALKDFIDDAPSIDMVRCAECTERDDDWCMYWGNVINPDDFCSYGEREGE